MRILLTNDDGIHARAAKTVDRCAGDTDWQAGEQQADDLQQLHGDRSEADAEHRGGQDADQDGLLALAFREPSGCKSDDDRIVPGKHQVDHDDLGEGGETFSRYEVQSRISRRAAPLEPAT